MIRVPRRDALLEHLTASGIGCAVYYPLALHLQPCFAHLGYREGQFPESEAATREVLAIPVYPELTASQRERVADTIMRFYGGRSG
jgi:dTDP-4-amino-4,6-dideoxygalactose transaminase